MRSAVLFLLTGSAAAEPLAAPDYFVEAAFAASTAQSLAQACSVLSVDPLAMRGRSETMIADMEADGFTLDNVEAGGWPTRPTGSSRSRTPFASGTTSPMEPRRRRSATRGATRWPAGPPWESF